MKLLQMKWRSTTGVLCDRRINERLKSKIYLNLVRLVALYGSECWPTIKDNKWRLAVMGTKMLCWTSDVTRFNHIRPSAIIMGLHRSWKNCERGVFDGMIT